MKFHAAALLCMGTSGLLHGCSLFSPMPLWELSKATAAAAGTAIPFGSSSSSNTVYHHHRAVKQVCIEFNPYVPVADIIPALQIELRRNKVESRLYDVSEGVPGCDTWLRYSASVEWGTPPLGDGMRTYLTRAELTLVTKAGEVLSTSQYNLDTTFNWGKWASSQRKLAPVVTALLTGFES
jgi:hypothetical protein